ncbi:STAS domain-containing protein [Kocuria sp. NPDC057446]|uniref:STAS domain-containing protein n=1 Tax=Kocuria sp. NPDC057446 TaxID=3346137 RepID=UPI003699D544
MERTVEEHFGERIATYTIIGELFFDSSHDLYTMFDYAGDPRHVVIDFDDSHLWDASTVAALDSVTDEYAHYGKDVEIVGLNLASPRMRVRLGGPLDNGGH